MPYKNYSTSMDFRFFPWQLFKGKLSEIQKSHCLKPSKLFSNDYMFNRDIFLPLLGFEPRSACITGPVPVKLKGYPTSQSQYRKAELLTLPHKLHNTLTTTQRLVAVLTFFDIFGETFGIEHGGFPGSVGVQVGSHVLHLQLQLLSGALLCSLSKNIQQLVPPSSMQNTEACLIRQWVRILCLRDRVSDYTVQ